jgi:uncharacterized protein (TIGR00369 family)
MMNWKEKSMSAAPLSEDQLAALLASSPFHQLFRIELMPGAPADELFLKLGFSPGVERIPASGQVHGGVLASLGDIAGSFLMLKLTGSGGATIHYSIDYHRPAVNSAIVARAKARRVGRSIGFVDVDLTDESGKLVAACRGIFATSG